MKTVPQVDWSKLWAHGVPDRYHPALKSYVNDRERPEGFLSYVLANDLANAAYRFDGMGGFASFLNVVRFVNTALPSELVGTYETVERWCQS